MLTFIIHVHSHLSLDSTSMTDAERDQIEAEAEDIIKHCRETIGLIRNTGIMT